MDAAGNGQVSQEVMDELWGAWGKMNAKQDELLGGQADAAARDAVADKKQDKVLGGQADAAARDAVADKKQDDLFGKVFDKIDNNSQKPEVHLYVNVAGQPTKEGADNNQVAELTKKMREAELREATLREATLRRKSKEDLVSENARLRAESEAREREKTLTLQHREELHKRDLELHKKDLELKMNRERQQPQPPVPPATKVTWPFITASGSECKFCLAKPRGIFCHIKKHAQHNV
jgi:hypothetical protein